MGRLSAFDAPALAELLRRQHGVLARGQAGACGLTDNALQHRIRSDGPWQVVLPGIYLTHRGDLTVAQRDTAAFLYAAATTRREGTARGVAVTGAAALARYGISSRDTAGTAARDGMGTTGLVDVLVPLKCRRRDTGFVRLHRTSVALHGESVEGVVRYAAPARAVADAVRGLRDAGDVRAVVAAGVQRGKVLISQLMEELDDGPVRGSAGLREAVREVAAGARSGAEIDFVRLVRKARLPEPELNPRLFAGEEFLAEPDAYWRDVAVAAEVESREWHLSPADWERTMARSSRMGARGITVLHFPPSRIRKEGWKVVAEIRDALQSAQGRPRPQIRVLPARGGD